MTDDDVAIGQFLFTQLNRHGFRCQFEPWKGLKEQEIQSMPGRGR